MLILDAPYYSFLKQIKRYGFFLPINWLLKYQIRTDRFIKKVSCPIFIFHGNKDRLIPFKGSKQLKAIAPERIMIYEIKEAGHNNMPDFPAYHEHLYNVLNDDELYRLFLDKISPEIRA